MAEMAIHKISQKNIFNFVLDKCNGKQSSWKRI